MKALRRWTARASGLFRRRRRELELAAEIESHIQLHTDDNLRRGMPPDQARRAAVLQLGSAEALKEQYRDQGGVPLLEHVVQDLRYAARTLRRSAGFTAIAVTTIAFGVFGPVVTFTMAKAWILEPLPFANPGALVDVRRMEMPSGDVWSLIPADFLDLRRSATTVQDIAGYQDAEVRVTGGDRAERLRSALVTANFFDLIGAGAAHGRVFAPGDDAAGAPAVAVISDALWRERFGGDPSIAGRLIRLDGVDRTIVGVLPADFQFTLLGRVDVWQPLAFTPDDAVNRSSGGVLGIARLAPGGTVDRARDELTRLAQDLAAAHPDSNARRSIRVVSLADEVRTHHDLGFIVPVLFAMVGCVLLIACANVTNVMLARTSTRRREMAVRLALGASRARIVRQWLVEHVLLFVVASVLGTMLAVYGADWITSSIPQENRQYLRNYAVLRVDAGVMAFALAIGVLCGILFGWIPAWTGAQANVSDDLRDASGRTTMSRGTARVRSALVVAEVALALALLISGGLLVQSTRNLSRLDIGFEPARLLTFRVALDEKRYATPAAIRTFYDRLVADLAVRPGITAAAAGSLVPFAGIGRGTELFFDGQPEPKPADTPWTAINQVTPGYGAALGLHLRRGRFVDAGDGPDSPKAVVVNETLVARHFQGRDPLGLRLRFDRGSKDLWTIVGVVADVKNYQPTDKPDPQIYLPLAQSPHPLMTVVVRTSGDPEALSGTVRAAIAALDPAEPVSRLFTMDTQISFVTKPFQTISTFVTFFGVLTLLLAGVGVYGVVAYTFAQRTREIGIRMALGARRLDVAALVLKQLRLFLLAALLPGLGLAWGLGQALEALLVGVSPTDWWLYVAMSALLAAVAFLGALVPARRATTIDPMTALRYE
jgi:predicted permease